MSSLPVIVAAVAGVLALGLLFAAVAAIRRRRFATSAVEALAAVVLLALAALLGVIVIATRGYFALTHEELAATVEVTPEGDRRFEAVVTLPDGRRSTFDLAGDQVYIDAHILKWKPMANLLGLHTSYELDRIGGRYDDIASELVRDRTVHSLKRDRPVDMFALARSMPLFGSLLDAEYGSATFQRASEPVAYDVFVSTSGLLIRPAE